MCLHITKSRHGTRPADAEAETREKTSRGPRTTQTARCRSGRIPGATAAQPANAATLLGCATCAQPPKTAPNRDLVIFSHSLGPPPRSSARAAIQPSSQPQSRAYGEPSDAAPHANSQRMLAGASGAAPLDGGGLGGGPEPPSPPAPPPPPPAPSLPPPPPPPPPPKTAPPPRA